MMRPCWLAFVAILGVVVAQPAGAADAKGGGKTAGRFEVEAIKGVAYVEGKDADPVRHKLDLYLPRGRRAFPVLFYVHGGGWTKGGKESFEQQGRLFARHGIGVVSVNYRLSPAVQHPGHVRDVAKAFAWTHRNIGKHGGRADQVFLSGHSAGGHLVALLGTDPRYLRAEKLELVHVKGVIPVSGVYEIKPGRWGKVFGTDPEGCAQASPLTHVKGELPPFLILYAEKDGKGFDQMAEEFCKALQSNKGEAATLKVDGRNHGTIMTQMANADDPATQAILAFIGRHAGAKVPAGAGAR